MQKNNGFTLIEIMVAVTLTGMILLTGYSAFQKIIQAQASLGASIDVQKNLFYVNEKLATLIRNGGTIDYEEYFNRRILGYDQSKRSDGVFTFTNSSYFGNGNDTNSRQTLYYCGVSGGTDGEGCMGAANPKKLFDASEYPSGDTTPTHNFIDISIHQPYGQYAALAFNYLNPGFPLPIKLPQIFTAADQIWIANRGSNGVITFEPENVTQIGLPELYLIKKNLDNTYTRTYFRHVYTQDTFVSTLCNPSSPDDPTKPLEGCLGRIQMLRLEACDSIGGTTDGIIDAWIPAVEFSIGTVECPTIASDIHSSAHEETITTGNITPNLTWVDVTPPDINVVRATFLPNPLKIPTLMSGAGDVAQSPRVSLYLEVALSGKLRSKSFIQTDMNYPRLLITTYDLSE